VVSLTLMVVGFLVVSGVVLTLARRSTARWERDRRASAKKRADDPARPAPSAGSAPAAVPDEGTHVLPGRRTQGTSRVRPVHWVDGVRRSSRSGDGPVGQKLLRVPVPRAPRRAPAFLHRHHDPEDLRPSRADTDESPAS
jgi:hypothetical protein